MIGPHPVGPARGLIALTVLVLPGDARDRYREEFSTELCELRTLGQLGQALTLLVGAIPLRQALQERDVIVTPQVKKDWRCRIGRHHYVGCAGRQPRNARTGLSAVHPLRQTEGPTPVRDHAAEVSGGRRRLSGSNPSR